jgi:hypothetical protein
MLAGVCSPSFEARNSAHLRMTLKYTWLAAFLFHVKQR